MSDHASGATVSASASPAYGSSPEWAQLARSAKQAKFALLGAVQKMGETVPNLRTNSISAAGIAAAILKKYDMPFKVVTGYVTVAGNNKARAHVWLHTPGLPEGDGNTDLTGFTDYQKELPMLGQYMFKARDSARCTYWPTATVPEGFEEDAKNIPVPILASHCANFDMYFFRGTEALRAARDTVLAYAFKTATEEMGKSDMALRQAQWGGAAGPGVPPAP